MSARVALRSAAVTVTTSSTAVCAANMGRGSVTLQNIDATNFVDITLATTDGVAPTATAGTGVRLPKAGTEGSTRTFDFRGAIAAIADTGSCVVLVLELPAT